MDWPVATIPDPIVHPTHTGGALLPLRWPHHGDLRIIVDHDTKPGLIVCAHDLHALAEYDIDLVYDVGVPHPTIVPRILWARHDDDGHPPLVCYSFEDAIAVLEHTPTHATGELLDWIRDQVPLVVRDEVLDAAIPLEGFLDAFTVAQAALILDRDPQINIGRTRLFAVLEQLGWTRRDDADHWEPTSHAHRHGLLTIRSVTIRSGTRGAEPYPQMYVTEAGLAELRRLLHALHSTGPLTVEQPTLPFDL